MPLNIVRTGPRDTSTVVLIHAVGLDLTYWDHQIEALQSVYDVIAFDLPGHGLSPGEPEYWTFPNAIESGADVIRSVGDRPVHLVGISFGGMIAQATALAEPKLIRSLTLIGTAPTFAEPIRAGMRARADAVRNGGMAAVLASSLDRWLTPETRARRPDLVDRISKTVLSDNPAIHAAIWDLIANDFDVQMKLGEIDCPTLIVVGERDPSTPPDVASRMAAAIPRAQTVVLPSTSHMATIESPSAVNAAMLRFLSTVDPRRI